MMWCLTLHSREQQVIFANLCQKTTVTEAMIGPRELSAEGQEHWHAFIQFNPQRTDRWRNEFGDKLNNMWIRPLQTQTNESIIQARHNYLRYCSKEGKPCYQKYIDEHELAHRPTSQELVNEEQELATEEDAELFALQPLAKK